MEDFLKQVHWGNTVKAYLIIIAALIFTWVILMLIRKYLITWLKKFVGETSSLYDDSLVSAFDRFIVPLIYINLNIQIISELKLSSRISAVLGLAQLIITVYYGIRIINYALVELLRITMVTKGEPEARLRQVNGLLNIIKTSVWIVGILFILSNRGVDITTFIAGLGVGGIAIALAAQNILGDVFNYFVIFFDKPFEVGDFVAFGTNSGTIENIGIKTTRIASITGQQLVVSNSVLTGQVISNYKRMPRRRVVFQIGTDYNLSAEQINEIPAVIEEIIKKDETLTFDRAHFMQFGASSIDFEIVYFVPGSDYSVYMDVHQRISVDIYKYFEKEGINFAFPSQTLFIEKNKVSFGSDLPSINRGA